MSFPIEEELVGEGETEPGLFREAGSEEVCFWKETRGFDGFWILLMLLQE